MQILRHVVLYGRVQGVFFRESMRCEALRLEVQGWVRNRRDGALEAMLQGKDAQVDALIAWARHGPPLAQVEKVEITEGSGVYSGFERLPSA